MAEQTSRLAIIIDSTGAKNNADNLTSSLVKMTQAGETAANSAGKVTKATEDEKNALAKLKAAIDPVGAAIDTVGRRYSELKKFFDKGLIDKEEYEFLVRKLNETTEELSGVAQAQREAEKAGKLAAAQQEAQAQAFQRMLDKIDPLAAALRNLEQQHDELNAAFASGKINGSQFENYSRKIQETRRELTGEAQAEREAAKAHDEQVVALQRLIAQLDPVGTAFNRLVEQQKQLNEAKAKGMLSPEMYEELSGKLRAMRSELEVTQSQLSKTGMSAKQTAFAMRMLPAQMTDIVVGLSTGQSPFMVLMQQGGQLKDMFGGIGSAIKGVGSYVLGLINPFTLAAAAVGVLGLAYYKGSQEQDEFNKSLILTGNQLGTTSGQLGDIAQRAGNAADSTTGAAAAVLNQLVRSGKVASSSLEQVTTAIVKTSEVTGISTEQLVNDFNEIAKDPVSAISKLNDQYHFLTLATYNQIKALQDEGNQQEAARIATEEYSSSMIQRTNQIKENLGYLETAWKAVADSAKWAWDSMLDIGREASLDQKISDVLRQIDEIEKNTRPGVFGLGGIGDGGAQNKRLARLKQQLGVLQAEKIAQDVLNSSINDYNKRQQEGIELRQRADAFSKQYQTREQQRASELAKLEKLKNQYSKWVSGASQGFNNWLDDTKDISEQIKSTTTQMFDGMTDALGDFVTTGKANFRSFATSVISDLSRMALKASITGIFDSISNSSSGGILGTIGSAISKFIPNAKGGVYESPSLSTYSNGIYDSPQFFAFAKGAGVFGEAGPEAIMPLTRTSDGSLGVRAINSKSGNGGGDITYAPVYQITIQNDGQNGEIGPQAIKALMGMVDQRVQGNLLNMRRDGGILSG
ncbi:phage tail tape measure protein [Escherichia coli]|nr:phage tail tape measure protein [Escherichia coli]